jgi:hypothetical protein
MQLVPVGRAHQFALFQVNQNERALHRAHHERTWILI